MLKETSVAGYVGLMDLNKAGSKITSITYNGMVAPFVVAYIYFLLTTTLASGMNRFERRMRKSD